MSNSKFTFRKDAKYNSITANSVINNSSIELKDIYSKYKDSSVSLYNSNGSSVGSGFFIRPPDGFTNGPYVVTCAHVVINGNNIKARDNIYGTITNYNNSGIDRVVKFDIIGIDGAADVAVLRAENSPMYTATELEWGDSRATQIGSTMYIIGNPGGIDHQSVTRGVVRDNQHTDIDGGQPCENILTDSSISGGNSGSPILDINGKVIGILSYGWGGLFDDINGGTAQYILQPVINRIIAGNRGSSEWTDEQGDYTKKGYLGINWKPVTLSRAVLDGYAGTEFKKRGILIEGINGDYGNIKDSDISVGDYITEIDGVILGEGFGQIAPGSITWFKKSGETVEIKYIRPSEGLTENTITVTLADFPNSEDYPLNYGPGYNV